MNNYDKNNKEDLKFYLNEHFYYEISMFLYVYKKIINCINHSSQKEKNMVLECLCLHIRNILEFLFFNKSKNYNRAIYYLNKDQWENFVKNKKTNSKLLMGKINDKVSHLNFNRDNLNNEKYRWKSTEIFDPLLQDIKQFLFLLPEEFCTKNLLNLKKPLDFF